MSDDYRTFSDALRRLLNRPELRDRFMQEETTSGVKDDLGVSDAMATELKQILLKLGSHNTISDNAGQSTTTDKLQAQAEDSVSSAEEFLNRSFHQLHTGARVLMVMSIVLFAVGVGFLLLAAIRTFTHPNSIGVTAIVGGIGIVQIVGLFYRNPLRDIARSISNAQQAKMIVMSYMLGVHLIGKSISGETTEDQQKALSKLTEQAIEHLERFTEYQENASSGSRFKSQQSVSEGLTLGQEQR